MVQSEFNLMVSCCISLIIAKIQAFDAAAFVAELFLVYCSCYYDRLAILDSNRVVEEEEDQDNETKPL
jgi:hypothetical protein